MATTTDRNLDYILAQLGGFGKYQAINFFFVCLAVVYSTMQLSYVFTARNVDYRCKIDTCDSNESPEYNPNWITNAVPFHDGVAKRCEKYKLSSNETWALIETEECPVAGFDKSGVEQCEEYVYKDPDITIVQDFDIHCDHNLWILTTVGTINNLGQFVCLPLAGYISDRWGRRTLLLFGLLLSGTFGVVRSFSPNYIWFYIFEFLDLATGGASFSSAFILALELVGPEKRVISGAIMCSCFSLGEVLMTFAAWQIQSWRPFLMAIKLPGILLVAYFWLIPESVRWLLAKGQFKRASDVLRVAARVNKKTISEDALQKLSIRDKNCEENYNSVPLRSVFKSPILLVRLIICAFCWITCGFVFYGLSLNSVTIAGNFYVNFSAIALIEIPAQIVICLCSEKMGRKLFLSGAYLIAGLACLSFIFVPNDMTWLGLCMFLLGKFGVTGAFTMIYVYTAEIFPTPLRHILLGTCSMFGRIGSMTAPQTPLLANIWTPLPILMFAGMSIIASFLMLLLPETWNIKLPDTIEEAENINKKTVRNIE